MLIPQKDKEISNPNNQNIFIKEKLNGQLKNNKDKNNKNIESDKIIEDEGNNNFMYDIKDNKNIIDDSRKFSTQKEQRVHISNLNDNIIKTENLDDFLNENNINNNIGKLSIIPKEEETFESINIIKESDNNNILTKEQILYYTHIIFLNNSLFAKNKECYLMSKSNFLNILKSIKIIKSQLILVQIDLIYDSISSKSSMVDYSQFNQILMQIIQKIYKEQYSKSPQLTINYFINKLINHYNLYFENKIPKDYLYKYQYNSIVKILQIFPNENQIIIINEIILTINYFLNKLINQYKLFFGNKIPKDYLYKYQYNSIVKLLQIFPNQNQIFIMNEIFITINEIYEKYFIFELNYNHEYIYKSGENLIKFCKDFEIVPQIINSTQAMTYYNLAIHINQIFNYFDNKIRKFRNFKNKGIIFTLIHFMIFFIHISLYSYTKIFGSKTYTYDENNEIMTNEAKLVIFLEKLEHSKGMTNFLSKLYTPRTKPLSLIPPKKICIDLGILESDKKKIKATQFLDEIFQEQKELEQSQQKEITKGTDKVLLEE